MVLCVVWGRAQIDLCAFAGTVAAIVPERGRVDAVGTRRRKVRIVRRRGRGGVGLLRLRWGRRRRVLRGGKTNTEEQHHQETAHMSMLTSFVRLTKCLEAAARDRKSTRL